MKQYLFNTQIFQKFTNTANINRNVKKREMPDFFLRNCNYNQLP